MSNPIVAVFAEADASLEALSLDLEQILGFKLEKDEEYGEESYYGYNSQIRVWLFADMGFENDGTANFEDYSYYIDFEPIRTGFAVGPYLTDAEWDALKQRCYDCAQLVFEGLKKLNRYKLMVVRDLFTKVDEAVPTK